jgi:putative transposase
MSRANRHFVNGHIWHITERCIDKSFLLKFARDRRRWLHWLFMARRRYGLCVLNYIVTSNHIHLLVVARGAGEIAASMNLVAGRVAQEFNRRKHRSGPYWEDRYHATAVQSDAHLNRCITYIDLNMVRAGVVRHPREWVESGYVELLRCPSRYRIVDTRVLCEIMGCTSVGEAQAVRIQRIDDAIASGSLNRESAWSESIAVGDSEYVEAVRQQLGASAKYRQVWRRPGGLVLKELMPLPYRPVGGRPA